MAKFVTILAVVLLILAAIVFVLQNREAAHLNDGMAEEGGTRLPEAEEGALVARAAPLFDPAPGERVLEKGEYVTYVYFTRKGFMPAEVTVAVGEQVRFLNASSLAMRVGSRPENSSSVEYASFNDPEARSAGGNFTIAFAKPGIWAYENIASGNARLLGTVFVK